MGNIGFSGMLISQHVLVISAECAELSTLWKTRPQYTQFPKNKVQRESLSRYQYNNNYNTIFSSILTVLFSTCPKLRFSSDLHHHKFITLPMQKGDPSQSEYKSASLLLCNTKIKGGLLKKCVVKL